MAAAIERERKFLVDSTEPILGLTPTRLSQAYFIVADNCEARIRIYESGSIVTFKAGGNTLSRVEEEFVLTDRQIARELFEASDLRIIKDRYSVALSVDSFWEVDVFLGDNEGLIVAEIELPEENAPIQIPDWCRMEVTGDDRFYNAQLASNPMTSWDESTRSWFGL